MIAEGCKSNTIKNPERLLHDLAWCSLLFWFFAVAYCISVLFLIFGIPGVPGKALAGFFISATFMVICLVSGFMTVAARNNLNRGGAKLVKEWRDVPLWADAVPVTLEDFPQSAMELESYRDWLEEQLSKLASRTTELFNQREEAQAGRETAKKHKLHPPEWPSAITPGRISAEREKYCKTAKEAIASCSAFLDTCENIATVAELEADAANKRYTKRWKFVEQLGEFYGINVLPIDPSTNCPLDDPDKFRKSLISNKSPQETEEGPVFRDGGIV